MSGVIVNKMVAVDARYIRNSDTRADFSRASSRHVMQAFKLREMVTIRRSAENTGFRQQASMTRTRNDAGA
jgi:hypothetical protein